ncbi:hypothetical protein OCS_05412 [Ophiocordyceps sinensis CO18]|uniref:Uncharacterized protein n=1 Tax=Ophiocordyceps sinensis (strain Co18 / CGMCC 3.14243) TaxID=911162 RepID=T5AAV0_OPHSC|nr:hypothetical protein OCS_05412 [Ophiocordyceps sinensis CO18]
METAGAGRLPGGRGLRRRGLRQDGDHDWLDKHAVFHGTVKVVPSLDAAVILARLFLELDADPFSDREVGLAGEANDAPAAIAELDRLAKLEVGHHGQQQER